MALATRCPHCHTTFRVAHDQLKLRTGLVRCGACKEIFNGIEHLLPASALKKDATPTSFAAVAANAASVRHEPTEPASPMQSSGVPERSALSSPQVQAGENFAADVTSDNVDPVSAAANSNVDPLQRMTLMDFSAWKEADGPEPGPEDPSGPQDPLQIDDPALYSHTELPADAPDELDRAIDDLQRKPWRRKSNIDDDIAGDDDVSEPDFVRRARRKQQIDRGLHLLTSVGSAVLLVVLVGQAIYAFRNQISAWLPQTTSLLVTACAQIGCNVGLPAQIESVSIESSELQALIPNQNTFVLNTMLRNRSTISQAWPSIELTLNDANEKAIARRVFSPREYLTPANDPKKGFDATSEQQVRVFFELSDLNASGYRVYLFYP
jgi:predicted Zn finger-like uncharacterized protein